MMTTATKQLITQAGRQWEYVKSMVALGDALSPGTRDRVSAQVENSANRCLAVTREITPDAPDRRVAERLEDALVRAAAEVSEEGGHVKQVHQSAAQSG